MSFWCRLGFGWQVQIGSITPVYSISQGSSTLSYYIYTDGAGSQYILNGSDNNVWSSSTGAYVWFDANANVLHFPDGKWWLMGCTSSSGEPDSGTMYPTKVEDTNGNYVSVTYLGGAGVPAGGVANGVEGVW